METTPNGQDGRHVRPHVVSASELVTEHAPTLNPSSEDYHAKSRVWACQTKRNIVTCVSVEVFKIFSPESFWKIAVRPK